MSKGSRMLQKLSRKSSEQKPVNQADHEEDKLIDTKTALSQAQHASGDAMHNSVLQLQRTIGNRAVGELVSQRNAEPKAVQRVIDMEDNGLPKLPSLFNQAVFEIARLVNMDTFARFKAKLAADHPMKTKTFQDAWAIKTMRPTILQFAQSEFSPENINFLLAIETYKEAPSQDSAVQIYTDYIRVGAATQINISSGTRGEYDTAITALTDAPVTRGRR